MGQKNEFKAVKGHRHLYVSRRKTKKRGWTITYIAVMRWWDGRDVRKPLSGDKEAALGLLRDLESKNAHREPFETTREARAKAKAAERTVMTVADWAGICGELPEVKQKRSLSRDKQLNTHIVRLLGDKPLVEISRADLLAYLQQRRGETLIRGGRWSEVPVKDGAIRNELASLRRMINLARAHGIAALVVSFDGIIPKAHRRARILNATEEKKLLDACPTWLRRLFIVANETALSRADILRLTWDMIDEDGGVIVPTGGRTKTGVAQASPLTDAVRRVLREIRDERKVSKVQPLSDLVFTKDGKPVTGNMVNKARLKACRDAGVKDFRFHDFRHCAKTRWADEGIHVDAAMLAAGQKSVQMHQLYVHMQSANVAKAFGTSKKFYNSFTTNDERDSNEAAG